MPLTPEAKKLLAETIRGTAQDPEKGIRARLLRAIHDEADRRYWLSVDLAGAAEAGGIGEEAGARCGRGGIASLGDIGGAKPAHTLPQ
jgi:hypothetical protein